jgi:hypothetical protein
MKNRKLLGGMGLICILAVVYLVAFRRLYFVQVELDRYVHILWNKSEAFLFISKKTTGNKDTPLGAVYHAFMGIFDLPKNDYKNDIMVVHLVNGKRESSFLDGVESSGTPFPCNGNIYYSGTWSRDGLSSNPNYHIWRWNGKEFQKIEDEERQRIFRNFQYFSDVIKKEGWKEADIPRSATDVTLELTLGSVPMKLETQETNGRVILQGRTNAASSETLAEVVPRWKHVSKREYFQIFK